MEGNSITIIAQKPTRLLQKEVKVELGALLWKSMEAFANRVTAGLIGESFSLQAILTALGIATTPEEHAWTLMADTLTAAADSATQILQPSANATPEQRANLIEQLHKLLEENEVDISADTLDRPREHPLVEPFAEIYRHWLEDMGVPPKMSAEAKERLPQHLAAALHSQLAKHHSEYAPLLQQLTSPASSAVKRELEWGTYRAHLRQQVREPLSDENFSLRDIYVPLRTYPSLWQEKGGMIDDTLMAWLNKADANDALRVICGALGAGTSSVAQMFAARVVEECEKFDVLFLPLNVFDFSDQFEKDISRLCAGRGICPDDPWVHPRPRLLLILDDLDAIAETNVKEIASTFVSKLRRQIKNRNHDGCRIMCLVTGHDIAFKHLSNGWEQHEVLHLMPYKSTIDNDDNNETQTEIELDDDTKFLEYDQREAWAKNYAKATSGNASDVLNALRATHFDKLTRDPLLTFLAASSMVAGTLLLQDDVNKNSIYKVIIDKVYERQYLYGAEHEAREKVHAASHLLRKDEFERILELIALAAWRRDAVGRGVHAEDVKKLARNMEERKWLKQFKKTSKSASKRLLEAFYLREAGEDTSEAETFVFTHRTFGEYLSARRLVHESAAMAEALEDWNDNVTAQNHNVDDALAEWARLCGPTAMDMELLQFIRDECELRGKDECEAWQSTLVKLISYMLRHGMPMQKLSELETFKQRCIHARNAEEALLVMLNACARVTKKVSEIEWPSQTAAGEWIAKLRGQRFEFAGAMRRSVPLSSLSWLSLREQYLWGQEFRGGDFEQTDLANANLCRADLTAAHLYRANLTGANLTGTRLLWVDLKEAKLPWLKFKWEEIESIRIDGVRDIERVLGLPEEIVEKYRERDEDEGEVELAGES